MTGGTATRVVGTGAGMECLTGGDVDAGAVTRDRCGVGGRGPVLAGNGPARLREAGKKRGRAFSS